MTYPLFSYYTPGETHSLQKFNFILIAEGKQLRAGTGRFGAENLETVKAKWRCLDQMWGALGNTAVFEQRSSVTTGAVGCVMKERLKEEKRQGAQFGKQVQ